VACQNREWDPRGRPWLRWLVDDHLITVFSFIEPGMRVESDRSIAYVRYNVLHGRRNAPKVIYDRLGRPPKPYPALRGHPKATPPDPAANEVDAP
jgi:hypothetical protein